MIPCGGGKEGDCLMSLGKDWAEPSRAPKGRIPALFQTPTAGWAGAEDRGNPEVGGAGVKDHGEFLGWGPDGDYAKVLILLEWGWEGVSGIGKGKGEWIRGQWDGEGASGHPCSLIPAPNPSPSHPCSSPGAPW